MQNATPLRVGQVFVPGGRPVHTYVPRAELQLEDHIDSYLAERGKVLSVSGPTKTGKTVLLKARIEDALWLSGGTIATIEDFWEALVDRLGLYTDVSKTGEESATEGTIAGGELSAYVVKGSLTSEESSTSSISSAWSRSRSKKSVAREAILAKPWDYIIVIDDFHYVPQKVQESLIRSVKDLVFDGLALILVAVPHRAYDVVRVEKEMTGRVSQLEVGFWNALDLAQIATRGFAALNVETTNDVVGRLVAEAFQSPHLMQEFCRELLKSQGIIQTVESRTRVSAAEWDPFFRRLAPDTAKAAFDLLARGPRQRKDRKTRQLATGKPTDIYGAVLRAIAATGPLTALTYEQLRSALRDVLASDPPQRHEVTRVLDEMARIARDQIDGEPVVDYDNELATLYVADPYFAYWLRWGAHESERD